jgi:hypothetical protein
MFSSEVELPAGSPLSKNSTINNISWYIWFVEVSCIWYMYNCAFIEIFTIWNNGNNPCWCRNEWIDIVSIKDKIMFSSEVELPAGSPLSKNSTINNIILYNARGILFLDDSMYNCAFIEIFTIWNNGNNPCRCWNEWINIAFVNSSHINSNFSLPRDKVSSYNAIKVTIGAENFGTLVKITDG